MIRILFISIITSSMLFSSIKEIENKINQNKEIYEKELKNKLDINNQIDFLAKKINNEEENYKKIVEIIENTNTTLMLNKLKLSNAKENLLKLQESAVNLKTEKNEIEQGVIDFVIEKYSMSLGVQQAKKESVQEIVDKEVYSLVLENAKQEVLDLNIDYLKVNRATRQNQDKTKDLVKFIGEQEHIKNKYLNLQEKQKAVIDSLELKHKQYQAHLKNIIDKQNSITDLLGNLNILKKQEIDKQREKERIEKEKAIQEALAKKAEAKRKQELEAQRLSRLRLKEEEDKLSKEINTKQMKTISREKLDDEIDIEVRKIGSSTSGIKISKYYGNKTISPLKSYTITKEFGKYYDKVYKMELFNESVSLKTKIPNAKVLSVFKGEIVYAKQNSGLLENVVIVKHKGNLHTIYSHLDKISPTLKVGKWIPKGYVVGRVNDTLLFQATKDSKYIDPTKLFK